LFTDAINEKAALFSCYGNFRRFYERTAGKRLCLACVATLLNSVEDMVMGLLIVIIAWAIKDIKCGRPALLSGKTVFRSFMHPCTGIPSNRAVIEKSR
jgi:hypothetical protein